MPEFTVTVDAEATVSFEVFCGRCGKGICNNCTEGKTRGRGYPILTVDPCSDCCEAEADAGYRKGYDAAKAENV